MKRLSRRTILRQGSMVLGAFGAQGWSQEKRRLKVAALLTAFHYRSHAHVILENFLVPYLFNGKVVDPREEFEIAGLYTDQFPSPKDDQPRMAEAVSKQFGIARFGTIEETLRLGGGDLAVDAVLLIAEHGEYPFNDLGQELYPKQRFYDEVTAVFRDSGRFVPVYTDKHLSHSWEEALGFYETAKRMDFGLMAGSSVPLAERRPLVELPAGAQIEEAVSIHGGPLERFGFHGLEVLQSMVESRVGGETGISEITYVEGDALWRAAQDGRWSEELARTAMAAELGTELPPLRQLAESLPGEEPPHGFLLRYRDGLKATVLKLGTNGIRWNFACRVKGQPVPLATSYYVGPWNNRNLFKALAHAIQGHFREGRCGYPVERTLLTSGALEAALRSRQTGGKPVPTPHLEFAYQPRDFRDLREMGATWKIITEETPQPGGIEATGIAAP